MKKLNTVKRIKKISTFVSLIICLSLLMVSCTPKVNLEESIDVDLKSGSKVETTTKDQKATSVKTTKKTTKKKVNSPFKQVKDYKELKKLIKANLNVNENGNYGARDGMAILETATSAQADMATGTDTNKALTDYSETNNQVQGVDEADIIKTDGKFIYYLKDGKIIVVKANQNGELDITSEINFELKKGANFYANELFLHENMLVVMGTYYEAIIPEGSTITESSASLDAVAIDGCYMPSYMAGKETTKIIIYDISDKSNIKELRTVEMEGSYLTSRKIGNSLYLVSNKYFDYYRILNEELKEDEILPAYKDSNKGDDYISIKCNTMIYYDNFNTANYVMIAGIDLSDLSKEIDLTTILGAAQTVYCSTDNLYFAQVEYNYDTKEESSNDGSLTDKIMIAYNETCDTNIFKFELNNGVVTANGSAKVPGNLINQFSMDEYDGYFRIATTTGQTWNDENPSYNNVYILDKDLKTVGKLEDLAKGEKIYSTRFMGNKLYMVTFKQVDPLFVIDLSNPNSPVVAGELKLPGYSSYMQAYDENHIIGIGYDTEAITEKYDGKVFERIVQKGLKMAMFDVSDMNNPKLLHETIIGGQGTYSEALYNHKAVLLSKDKNLFALPISISNPVKNKNGDMIYNPEKQGAFIFDISIENGFILKEKLTNQDKADQYGYYIYEDEIRRISYIGNNLYTFSQKEIKSFDINTLKELDKVNIK